MLLASATSGMAPRIGIFKAVLVDEAADLVGSAPRNLARKVAYAAVEVDDLDYKRPLSRRLVPSRRHG
jgi:hypothetical protein